MARGLASPQPCKRARVRALHAGAASSSDPRARVRPSAHPFVGVVSSLPRRRWSSVLIWLRVGRDRRRRRRRLLRLVRQSLPLSLSSVRGWPGGIFHAEKRERDEIDPDRQTDSKAKVFARTDDRLGLRERARYPSK